MNLLIYFIILFFSTIIIINLFKGNTIEGLDDCSKEEKNQNSRVYKNAGIIQQQQDSIKDFKKTAEDEIQELSKRIDGFQKMISQNTKQISTNDKTIKAVASKAMAAAKAKQAKMDKLSMS